MFQGRKLLTLPTTAGLTPLMFAVINGQTAIVDEYFANRNSKKDIYFHKVVRDTKQTLLFLLFLHCPGVKPSVVLKRKDLTGEVVNAVDSKGNTALMACCLGDCRDTVRRLLSSKAATERHLFDLSVKNVYDKTALHILAMNNDKYNVRLLLNLLEDAGNSLNSVDQHQMTPLMYALNRGYWSVADAITNHPKAKFKIDWAAKDPKGRTLTLMVEEGAKLRMEEEAANAPAPKPEPTPGPRRNFQQEMNDIYKLSKEVQKQNAPNPANALKKQEPVKPKAEPVKTKEVERPKEVKNGGLHANGNGSATNGKVEEDDGPSIADIRNQFKVNKKTAEERRKEIEAEFTSQNLLDDMMKKAEQKVNESKDESSSDNGYITEGMDEEIQWALNMKREQAEASLSGAEKDKREEKKREEQKTRRVSQEEKMRMLKEKEAEERKTKNAHSSEKDMMSNISNSLAMKAETRQNAKDKRLAPERQRIEDKAIEDSMSEEIQWALDQKRQAAEEEEKNEIEIKKAGLQEEESERIMKGIREKNEAKANIEAERLKKIEEEKERLARAQRETEEKIRKRREAQILRERKQVEEDDSLAKLPKWKREKVLKEREIQAAKDAEEDLKQRMTEELEWAENLKNQQLDDIEPEKPVTMVDDTAEKEKKANAIRVEQDNRREANKKLEAEKRAAEQEALDRARNPTYEDLERRRQEDADIHAAMSEEIQWAMEQKKQQAENMKTKEQKASEAEQAKKLAEEEDRKIVNSISERKKIKEDKEAKEQALKEKERINSKEKTDTEKKKLEDLEKMTLQIIEAKKKDSEALKQQKIKEEREKQRKEEEERKQLLEEDLRWAEEARLQEELTIIENERKATEKIASEKKAKEDAEREKQRQLALQKEKEMLEKLEKAAAEKLEQEKEEEEIRKKKEQEAWVKMPQWKKDKILRERRASSTASSATSSRKSSLAVGTDTDKLKSESPKVESPIVETKSTNGNVVSDIKKKENETKERERIEAEEMARNERIKEEQRQLVIQQEMEMVKKLEKEAAEKLKKETEIKEKEEQRKLAIQKEKETAEILKKETEAKEKEKQRQLAIKKEKEMLEKLEKEAAEKIKKRKDDEEKERQRQLIIWKEKEMVEKLEREAADKIKKKKEDEEKEKQRLLGIEKEKENKKKLEKEEVERIKKENEEKESRIRRTNEEKEKLRQLAIQKEKDMVEKLEKAAEDKIKKEKATEEMQKKQNDAKSTHMNVNGSYSKPSVTSTNGAHQVDVNAIWNDSISRSSTKSPEQTMEAVLSQADSSQANGEDVTSDKFSEWLKQELQQSEDTLKPPAPARRRRGKEETEDSVTRPVAAARRSKRSPLPPSPAPAASKAELSAVILESGELEDPEHRAELLMIIQAFIMEKRGKL